MSTGDFLHLSKIQTTKFLKYLTFLSISSSRFLASALCASNFFAVATSVSSSLCNVTISEPRVFISISFCCFSCSSLEWSLHQYQHSINSTMSITASELCAPRSDGNTTHWNLMRYMNQHHAQRTFSQYTEGPKSLHSKSNIKLLN